MGHYKGLVEGTGQKKFEPNNTMTRGMYITVLWRAAARLGDDVWVNYDDQLTFTDVGVGDYFLYAVKWAAGNGLVNGTSKTTFSPGDAITREQMAVMLYNFGEYMGLELSGVPDDVVIDFLDEGVSE